MNGTPDHLDLVVALTDGLRRIGLDAVMVGGTAMVVRRARGHHVLIASDEDLLALKEAAVAARHAPGDAEDIAFLKARRRQ